MALILSLLLCYGAAAAQDFDRALSPRTFVFPTDHGDHPTFQTEWWYITGQLQAQDGAQYGYQLTFFRRAFGRQGALSPQRPSDLAMGDLIIYHAALTDIGQGRFHQVEDFGRRASNWAGAAADSLDVHLYGHWLKAQADGSFKASFSLQQQRLELHLTPSRPPVLHGLQPGLSPKGPEPGQASYYYSIPRLATQGFLDTGQKRQSVRGTSWFDHEFGSNQLDTGQVGWDWFAVSLSDGSDLMLYLLRYRDNRPPSAAGTLVEPDGTVHYLPATAFQVEPQSHWTSPHSGARYPAAWEVILLGHDLQLTVEPLLADQELQTGGSTGVTYWEGLCRFFGQRRGQSVEGKGYVELVGYAGAFMGGL
ncbi:MAG: carotenoid 1,2-hydratase [Candidatus Latescibacteria bacterium]|nr:carotenoid 1,2-hydratase [Candidatus Latescibacterota bacterium]